MPTVTVTYTDGTTQTYHPQVARAGGIDLQLCGDPDHWPVLDLHRDSFTKVDVDGARWRWDGPRPEGCPS